MKRIFIMMGVIVLFSCGTEERKDKKETVVSANISPEVKQQIDLLRQYPDSLSLQENVIEVMDSLGAWKEALAELNKLIKKDSLNSFYWTKKGELAEKSGDTSVALQSYKYALRIYRSPDVLLRAANLLAERKNDTALLIVNSISDEWSDRTILSHAAFIRGVYFARKGLSEQAQQAFDACIRYNYQYLEAYMEKGFLFWDAGNILAAKKIFTVVIQLKGTYPDGYYWLAKCEERLKDSGNARPHYQQAKRLDPALPLPVWVGEKNDN